jgi:hypothetical protein
VCVCVAPWKFQLVQYVMPKFIIYFLTLALYKASGFKVLTDMTFISNKLYTDAIKWKVRYRWIADRSDAHLHSPICKADASPQEWLPSTIVHSLSSSAVYDKEGGGTGI